VSQTQPYDDNQSDTESIGHAARDDRDRRQALQACLNSIWANEDIAKIVRLDNSTYHGWLMWRMRSRHIANDGK